MSSNVSRVLREYDFGGLVKIGTQVRPAEELVTALRKGGYLEKYGRYGQPKCHHFRLSGDDTELQWDSAKSEPGKGKVRSISLLNVVRVQPGQLTSVFKRKPEPSREHLSFSLIYKEGPRGKERSLDLICNNSQEYEIWFYGLQLVQTWCTTFSYQPPPDTNARPTLPSPGGEALEKAKASQPQLSMPMGGGLVAGRVSGVLGFPAKREIGDCYIWGQASGSFDYEIQEHLPRWQQSSSPVMVANTVALDIIQVACGPRHAALITRGGELYTWGIGKGGRLGHGTQISTASPTQVVRLFRKGIRSVACADLNTAAVASDGSLYAWGHNHSGQLGTGNTFARCWPTRLPGFDAIRFDQVACGPFHSAAITTDGVLFTWGEGLFGKLGHGDEERSYSPRPVAAMMDRSVSNVSCGWWHTAAVAQPRSSTTASKSSDGTTNGRVSFKGGALYSWGGEFTWVERAKPDHHQGCLGHGDLDGRLVPTHVGGELERCDVKQVACGLNLTLVVTADGCCYQMGATGAFNASEKNALWEGARVPVQVDLNRLWAEQVACGAQHVALVVSMVGEARTAEAGHRTRLLCWGKGSCGQLGLGSLEDHAVPQVVAAVDGRRITHIACGGHHTLAVCEHDPHSTTSARASRDVDDSSLRALQRKTIGLALQIPGDRTASAPATISAAHSHSRAGSGAAAAAGASRPESALSMRESMTDTSLMALGAAASAQAMRSRLAFKTMAASLRIMNHSRRDSEASSTATGGATPAAPVKPKSAGNQKGAISTQAKVAAFLSSGSSSRVVARGSRSREDLSAGDLSARSSFSGVNHPSPNPSMAEFPSRSGDITPLVDLASAPTSLDPAVSPGQKQVLYWKDKAMALAGQLQRRNTELEALRRQLSQANAGQHTPPSSVGAAEPPSPNNSLPTTPSPSPHLSKSASAVSLPNMPASQLALSATAALVAANAVAAGAGAGAPPPPTAGQTKAAPVAAAARAESQRANAPHDASIAGPPRTISLARGPSLGVWQTAAMMDSLAPDSAANSTISRGGAESAGIPPLVPRTWSSARGDEGVGQAGSPTVSGPLHRGVVMGEAALPLAARELTTAALRRTSQSGDPSWQAVSAQGQPGGGDTGPDLFAATRAVRSSSLQQQRQQQDGGGGFPSFMRTLDCAGTVLAVSNSVSDPGASQDAWGEMMRLREQNRQLQQELLSMRMSYVGGASGASGLAAMGEVPLELRSSAGSGVAGTDEGPVAGPSGRAPLHRHRRALSVDTAGVLNRSIVVEEKPGVFLTLEASMGGGYELRRIRFAKRQYNQAEAEAWWSHNRERVRHKYQLPSAVPRSPGVFGTLSPMHRRNLSLSTQMSSDALSFQDAQEDSFAEGVGLGMEADAPELLHSCSPVVDAAGGSVGQRRGEYRDGSADMAQWPDANSATSPFAAPTAQVTSPTKGKLFKLFR